MSQNSCFPAVREPCRKRPPRTAKHGQKTLSGSVNSRKLQTLRFPGGYPAAWRALNSVFYRDPFMLQPLDVALANALSAATFSRDRLLMSFMDEPLG
jgi:hypothetical protein